MLLDGHRLAGQRRFLDLQVDRVDHPRVGGHAVAGVEQDDVAGHDVPGRDLALVAVADDRCRRRGHPPQRFCRALGAVLLREPEQDGEQHDGRDGDRLGGVAEDGGERRGDEEDDDQDVLELLREDRPRRYAGRGLQLVGTVLGEARGGLGRRQASRAGAQLGEDGVHREGVPGGLRGA